MGDDDEPSVPLVQCRGVEPEAADPEPRVSKMGTLPPRPHPSLRGRPDPTKPPHRPVAERRAAVVALLQDGLSDREIARRVKVSPSTVATVRRERAEDALH